MDLAHLIFIGMRRSNAATQTLLLWAGRGAKLPTWPERGDFPCLAATKAGLAVLERARLIMEKPLMPWIDKTELSMLLHRGTPVMSA